MRFSVVVPAYNVAQYLRMCLDSVILAADMLSDEVEIICVDDGSTDSSGDILDEYAQRDSRIEVIHQTNSGVSAARNAAINVATGDWVLFVDGDDVISDASFVRLASVINSFPDVDIVSFGFATFADENLPIVESCSGSDSKYKDISHSLDYDAVWRELWQNCFKRSIIPCQGFRPYASGEDLLFLAETLCVANHWVGIRDRLYFYRIRQGSADHSGMNAHKLHDKIGYSMDRLQVLLASAKEIDDNVIRMLCNKLSEESCWALRFVAKHDADVLWKRLFRAWLTLSKMDGIGALRRIKFFMLGVVRVRAFAWMLLAIPYEIKRRMRFGRC